MPAIVALVAGNFPQRTPFGGLRARRRGGAIAVAAGPLVGGAVTTFASWRWVFAGEIVLVVVILRRLRRVQDTAAEARRPSIWSARCCP